ncbi:hypothetical protein C5B96_01155 [Subtercola sp. Z020]|nr:hypothetical protein C5B96_01155 [Subtercola sp. Z020]
MHTVPVELPSATVEQRWHRRADTDPASLWLRGALARTVGASMTPTPPTPPEPPTPSTTETLDGHVSPKGTRP